MPSHEEIVQKFVHSGAVNYDALGKFISEMGPQLTDGSYGIDIGRHNIIACFKIGPVDVIRSPIERPQLAADVLGERR